MYRKERERAKKREKEKVRYRRVREGAIVKGAQRHQSIRQREVPDPAKRQEGAREADEIKYDTK